MALNFKGGISLDDKKTATRKKLIEEIPSPDEVVLPLIQHAGVMCNPIVNISERVLIGQKIAETTKSPSAPIHASVSGTVTAIEPRPSLYGEDVLSVVIKNDFEDEEIRELHPQERFHTLSPESLADIISEAGIVGLSGAATPTSEKILSAKDCVDTLIINGAECEPYINSDNRMMIEYADELYDGALIVANALEIKNVTCAVLSNKTNAIVQIRHVLAKKAGVRLCVLHAKYPQGAERQLIKAVCNREVPPGKSGIDIGVLTLNVSTLIAISRAVREGIPLTSRVITVSGSAVANPKNLLVRLGTPISELITACGGFLEHPEKIIAGGPMMGFSQNNLSAPITKATNALLAFSMGETSVKREGVCIHCGKCAEACPMQLLPLYIYRESKRESLMECASLNVSDCIGCGCCSYICPARLPLTEEILKAKEKTSSAAKEEECNENR